MAPDGKRPERVQVIDTDFSIPASYAETEPFSKPHTVTFLVVTVALLGYVLYADLPAEGAQQAVNIKRGLAAALCVGLVFCAEHLRDTLFFRPHPAIWRFVNGVGLFYTMAMAFALFQPIGDLRDMMQSLDPVNSTGRDGSPLAEQSYASDCTASLPVIWAACDRFMVAHFVGWIFKAFMFRHVGMAMVGSFLFEILEYTFAYLQPNFAECWWDHWVLDFLLCNTGGIVVGHLLMDYFDSPEYSWVGIAQVPTVRGKLSRLGKQFTPLHWTRFEWAMFSDVRRFLYVVAIMAGTMLVELNAFFLKYLLHVQPASDLNILRLVLWWAVGMVGLRDYYAFMTNPRIKRLGATMWTCLAMCLMETLVVVRFGSEEWSTKTPPQEVVVSWSVVGTLSTLALVWWFAFELPRRQASGEEKTIGAIAASVVQRVTGRAAAAMPHSPAAPSPAQAGLAATTATTPRNVRELARLAVDGTPALGGAHSRQSAVSGGASPTRSASRRRR